MHVHEVLDYLDRDLVRLRVSAYGRIHDLKWHLVINSIKCPSYVIRFFPYVDVVQGVLLYDIEWKNDVVRSRSLCDRD